MNADASPKLRGLFGILAVVILVPAMALGVGAAMYSSGRPAVSAGVQTGMGLFFIALGLLVLCRLAAFGPKYQGEDRRRNTVGGAGQVIFGASMLMPDGPMHLIVLGLAFVPMLAGLLRRPKKFFATPQAGAPPVS